jgi:heme-degrading monooxygenase HmoA
MEQPLYLTREEVSVFAGSAGTYESSVEERFALLRSQPGFLRAILLNSLGFPARYTTLTQWQSREHGIAFQRGSQLTAFLEGHAADNVYIPSRPLEAYEVVHRVLGSGSPVANYLIDEVVRQGPNTISEFEETRGAVYQLRRKAGLGFAASLLSRFLGGSNRYLIFGGFNAEGDDRRTAESPEIVRYWQEHPGADQLVPNAVRDPVSLVIAAGPEPI